VRPIYEHHILITYKREHIPKPWKIINFTVSLKNQFLIFVSVYHFLYFVLHIIPRHLFKFPPQPLDACVVQTVEEPRETHKHSPVETYLQLARPNVYHPPPIVALPRHIPLPLSIVSAYYLESPRVSVSIVRPLVYCSVSWVFVVHNYLWVGRRYLVPKILHLSDCI
jgi:hypothetical protein